MKQFSILLKRYNLLRDLVLGVAATVVSCGVAAAIHTHAHPDSQQAVHSALVSHRLASVAIDQDQDAGVIRLTGIVENSTGRDRAQRIAQQAAPGYTIDNQIQVNRAGVM
ncbi:BON domain-containing protein [Occallatibacter riparius]|uniref:BON domain-containing protein n=1 Tax=Occallatibacter riparius TaxID=1002689 RepID=A0A9J7BKV4_9BACT|nr:BON domain-containing protein [Occallatibacter riparius]UWZ83508.1 BON domain-containing protein [Occallatibacter riparius]